MISNQFTLLAKIKDIGNEALNNTYAYIIKYADDTFIVLSPKLMQELSNQDIKKIAIDNSSDGYFVASNNKTYIAKNDGYQKYIGLMDIDEPTTNDDGSEIITYKYIDIDETERISTLEYDTVYCKVLNKRLAESAYTTNIDIDLQNFRTKFCDIILKYSTIDVNDSVYDDNDLYNAVLKYYANGGTDDTLQVLTKLGTTYGTTSSSTSSCGCSSSTSSTSSSTTYSTQICDCASQYTDYINQTLKTMLSSIDFYTTWCNEATYDALISLIDRFIDAGYNLTFSSTSTYDCPSTTSTESTLNYTILSNYRDALTWLEAGSSIICQNKNKIKSRGLSFAEILPYLIF